MSGTGVLVASEDTLAACLFAALDKAGTMTDAELNGGVLVDAAVRSDHVSVRGATCAPFDMVVAVPV